MPDPFRRTLPSLPVPAVPRRPRPVASFVATVVAIGAWVVLFAELGTSGAVPEPLTPRLAGVVRHLSAPSGDLGLRPHRRSDARATEASWTSRTDAPDAAAPDAGPPRPGL
jgi:hypothetical protein